MKCARSMLALVVLLALVQGSVASTEWISFDGNEAEATVSVTRSDMDGLALVVEMPGLTYEGVMTPSGAFARLSLDGCGVSTAVGEALLPVVREFVQIPLGSTPIVTVTAADFRRVTLDELGIEGALVPVQAPVEKMPGALEAASFAYSSEYYSRDSFGPEDVARTGDVQSMRGSRFVQLEISPVRYNPVRGELEYATRIEVMVDFPGADHAETRRVLDRYSNDRFDKLAGDTFINRDAFTSRYDIPLPIGYLIVAYDTFVDEIAPLAAWKEQKGYHTTVVSTSAIPGGNTKENIKAYIQDAYDNWAVPPTYVLLVGDTPQISHWVGTQSNSPSTDLYYVTMDGSSDWLPDIWIGRFSCTTESQVTNLVNKSVDYERFNLSSGTAWLKKAVFMASTDNHAVPEATHEYVIRQYLDPAGYTSERLYSYSGATTAQVSAAFNDGRSLGIYSGHGDVTYWADGPVFTASHVNALTNTDMLPLVHSYSCLTGQFSSACFGETWTNAIDKGAVVFWGSSVTSYWDQDDVLEKGAFKACFEEGYTWACGISHRALYWLYDYYSGGGSTHRYYEMYNILGDPSLDIWTDTPSTIVASYPGSFPAGGGTFDITVTSGGSPIENGLVCVAKDDDGVYEAAYTNASGVASIPLTPAPLTPGAMAVTVTKHDHYPHEGSTTISLSDNPYIVYESHIIDDDMTGDSIGDGDGVADAGEYIELPLTLENIGTVTGYGISALVSEGDPEVIMSDTYEEYGDIAVGSTAQSYDDYDFFIAGSCPDGHVAQLLIEATDGDSTWSSVVNIPISAPALSVHDYTVDDGLGDGNGCADPGETISISVTLANDGGDDATDVSADLSTTDPYVTVNQGTATYTSIPSGGTGVITPAYEVTIAPGAPSFHEVTLDLDISTLSGHSASGEIVVIVGSSAFEEDFESTGGDWTHYNVTGGFVDEWHVETYRYYSAGTSWKVGGAGSGYYSDSSDGALETPAVCVGTAAEFSFWSWLDCEEDVGGLAWDCALVEISTDGGTSWNTLIPNGGYSHTKNDNTANPVEEGTPCWSGTHDWREEVFDLAAYEGTNAIIRFRFASDAAVTQEGWYVDDVALTSEGTGVADGEHELPRAFVLRQNAPNPFNPMTTIGYSLPEAAHVTVTIFNVAGRLVTTLSSGHEDAGEKVVVWDGTDSRGRKVGSGVYLCSVTAGDLRETRAMVLLK